MTFSRRNVAACLSQALLRFALRQIARGADRIQYGSAFANADQVWVRARRAEAWIVGCGNDIAAADHLFQTLDLLKKEEARYGAQWGTTREVGCAQAMIGLPPGGGGPAGMMTTPETAIGSLLSPVDL
jgi:hypothetical protein